MAYPISSVEFIKSAAQPKHFPLEGVPEIAFAGRSNVGKSSLLNVLVQRKKIALTSRTPGKTRLINFFDVRMQNEHLWLVDLPGYGFSKAGKQTTQSWAPLIEAYLTSRESLKLTCALIDYRHKPSALDVQLIGWFRNEGIPYQIVLTKADKLNRQELQKNRRIIRETLGLGPGEEMIPFSSLKKTGRNELWKAIMDRL